MKYWKNVGEKKIRKKSGNFKVVVEWHPFESCLTYFLFCSRLFLFEEDSREVTFIASSNFHDHCVLKIKHVIHKSEHMPLALIVSAATDGRVAFWNISHICKSVFDDLTAKDKEDVRNSSGTTVFIEKKIQSQHTVNPDKISQLDPGSLHVEGDTENKSSGLKLEERLKKPELALVCSISCHQSGINSVFFGLYEGKQSQFN